MKIVVASLLLLVCAFGAKAVPARPTPLTFPDASGNLLTVRLTGDENYHYYFCAETGERYRLRGDTLIPLAADEMRAPAKVRRRTLPGTYSNTTFPARGEQKALVVLVDYRDVKFNLPDPRDYFTRMLNEEGFSDYWATGSARDWYRDSSHGLFTPVFDVFGPVTLQNNRQYYGGNDALGQDMNPHRMAIEACRKLNPEIDFTEYDRDHDGVIDNVFVVYAGRGEADGGSSDCVWPHAWSISSAEPGSRYEYDGVQLNRYACCNEWILSDLGNGFRPVGIGTFVHEFSHIMGLPDLYSTQYAEGTFTPGGFSVMDYGPYNNDGCTPPQFSAWERSALGYGDPAPLSAEAANVALQPLGNDAGGYVIHTPDPNEFFVLENRQQSGWDTYIPGHGLLVWHIVYDAEVWAHNALNNDPTFNRVDLIEADNLPTAATRSGDPFPGASGVTALSASTTPALLTHDGAPTGYALTDIAERGERLVMRLNGGAPDIDAPTALRAEAVAPASFTARWEPVAGASGYEVSLMMPGDSVAVFITPDNYLVISNLTPATDYSFTVLADDRCYGSVPSEPLAVRTSDPTFDYFTAPTPEASQVEGTAFTLGWDAMQDAEEYFVTVAETSAGPDEIRLEGFDNGIDALPEWLSTNSRVTYGMGAYSGEAAPALRLSRDGDYVRIDFGENDSPLKLSFWHRGNGTGTDEQLTLSLLRPDESWGEVARWPVTAEKGGAIRTYAFSTPAPSAQIAFVRPDAGAVAIDDVAVSLAGPTIEAPLEAYTLRSSGRATEMRIEGLRPATTYRCTVTARSSDYMSRPSATVEVTTNHTDGAAEEISDAVPAEYYTLQGIRVPSPIPGGIYIVRRGAKSSLKAY